MAGGRPPLPEGKAKKMVRSVHLSEDEDAAIAAAAERDGMRVTAWIRKKALAAAKRSR